MKEIKRRLANYGKSLFLLVVSFFTPLLVIYVVIDDDIWKDMLSGDSSLWDI